MPFFNSRRPHVFFDSFHPVAEGYINAFFVSFFRGQIYWKYLLEAEAAVI